MDTPSRCTGTHQVWVDCNGRTDGPCKGSLRDPGPPPVYNSNAGYWKSEPYEYPCVKRHYIHDESEHDDDDDGEGPEQVTWRWGPFYTRDGRRCRDQFRNDVLHRTECGTAADPLPGADEDEEPEPTGSRVAVTYSDWSPCRNHNQRRTIYHNGVQHAVETRNCADEDPLLYSVGGYLNYGTIDEARDQAENTGLGFRTFDLDNQEQFIKDYGEKVFDELTHIVEGDDERKGLREIYDERLQRRAIEIDSVTTYLELNPGSISRQALSALDHGEPGPALAEIRARQITEFVNYAADRGAPTWMLRQARGGNLRALEDWYDKTHLHGRHVEDLKDFGINPEGIDTVEELETAIEEYERLDKYLKKRDEQKQREWLISRGIDPDSEFLEQAIAAQDEIDKTIHANRRRENAENAEIVLENVRLLAEHGAPQELIDEHVRSKGANYDDVQAFFTHQEHLITKARDDYDVAVHEIAGDLEQLNADPGLIQKFTEDPEQHWSDVEAFFTQKNKKYQEQRDATIATWQEHGVPQEHIDTFEKTGETEAIDTWYKDQVDAFFTITPPLEAARWWGGWDVIGWLPGENLKTFTITDPEERDHYNLELQKHDWKQQLGQLESEQFNLLEHAFHNADEIVHNPRHQDLQRQLDTIAHNKGYWQEIINRGRGGQGRIDEAYQKLERINALEQQLADTPRYLEQGLPAQYETNRERISELEALWDSANARQLAMEQSWGYNREIYLETAHRWTTDSGDSRRTPYVTYLGQQDKTMPLLEAGSMVPFLDSLVFDPLLATSGDGTWSTWEKVLAGGSIALNIIPFVKPILKGGKAAWRAGFDELHKPIPTGPDDFRQMLDVFVPAYRRFQNRIPYKGGERLTPAGAGIPEEPKWEQFDNIFIYRSNTEDFGKARREAGQTVPENTENIYDDLPKGEEWEYHKDIGWYDVNKPYRDIEQSAQQHPESVRLYRDDNYQWYGIRRTKNTPNDEPWTPTSQELDNYEPPTETPPTAEELGITKADIDDYFGPPDTEYPSKWTRLRMQRESEQLRRWRDENQPQAPSDGEAPKNAIETPVKDPTQPEVVPDLPEPDPDIWFPAEPETLPPDSPFVDPTKPGWTPKPGTPMEPDLPAPWRRDPRRDPYDPETWDDPIPDPGPFEPPPKKKPEEDPDEISDPIPERKVQPEREPGDDPVLPDDVPGRPSPERPTVPDRPIRVPDPDPDDLPDTRSPSKEPGEEPDEWTQPGDLPEVDPLPDEWPEPGLLPDEWTEPGTLPDAIPEKWPNPLPEIDPTKRPKREPWKAPEEEPWAPPKTKPETAPDETQTPWTVPQPFRQPYTEPDTETETETDVPPPQPTPPHPQPDTKTKPDTKTEPDTKTKPWTLPQTEPDTKTKTEPDTKTETETQPKTTVKPDVETKVDTKTVIRTGTRTKTTTTRPPTAPPKTTTPDGPPLRPPGPPGIRRRKDLPARPPQIPVRPPQPGPPFQPPRPPQPPGQQPRTRLRRDDDDSNDTKVATNVETVTYVDRGTRYYVNVQDGSYHKQWTGENGRPRTTHKVVSRKQGQAQVVHIEGVRVEHDRAHRLPPQTPRYRPETGMARSRGHIADKRSGKSSAPAPKGRSRGTTTSSMRFELPIARSSGPATTNWTS